MTFRCDHAQVLTLRNCNHTSLTTFQLKIRPAMLTLKRLRLSSEIIVGTIAVDRSLQTDRPPDYWTSPREYLTILRPFIATPVRFPLR